jgi:predicted RNA methylase
VQVRSVKAETPEYPTVQESENGAVEVQVEYAGVPVKAEVADILMEKDRQIEVLKLIINILQSNPLIINHYIIADDEALEKMIKLLSNASDVQIDAEDMGVGCITKKTYRKVHSMYVTKDGKTLNLKYDFPDVMKTLKDLRISTKYVW